MEARPNRISVLTLCAIFAAVCLVAVGAFLGLRHRAVQAAADSAPKMADDEGGGQKQPGKGGGGNRWKDTGIYVDGVQVGVLSFGELPISLKPTWRDLPVSTEIEPGKPQVVKTEKQRAYRFTDLLTSLGIDLAKVKELHVYGPKMSSDVIITTGEELVKNGQGFMFHFASDVGGKPIPVVPPNFGNHETPDKLMLVAVYINKTPPTQVEDLGMALDRKLVQGVPYFGDPARGGIRVYQDDRLATTLRRRSMSNVPAEVSLRDGTPVRWSLSKVLAAQGMDLSTVREAWLIRDNRRTTKFDAKQLKTLTFEMADKGQNQVFIGDTKIPAEVIALHSRTLSANDLPQILAAEQF